MSETRTTRWWRRLWRNPWATVAAMAVAALITLYFVLDARYATGDDAAHPGWAVRNRFSPHEAWNPGAPITPGTPQPTPAPGAPGGAR